jgi:hypothetical protein
MFAIKGTYTVKKTVVKRKISPPCHLFLAHEVGKKAMFFLALVPASDVVS